MARYLNIVIIHLMLKTILKQKWQFVPSVGNAAINILMFVSVFINCGRVLDEHNFLQIFSPE